MFALHSMTVTEEEIDLYLEQAPYFQIRDLVSQQGDLDHPKNLSNCSFYHCRANLKIFSTSAHNLLSNVQILIGQSVW